VTVQNFLSFTKERRDLSFALFVVRAAGGDLGAVCLSLIAPHKSACKQVSYFAPLSSRPLRDISGGGESSSGFNSAPPKHTTLQRLCRSTTMVPCSQTPRAHTTLTIRCRANARRPPRSPGPKKGTSRSPAFATQVLTGAERTATHRIPVPLLQPREISERQAG